MSAAKLSQAGRTILRKILNGARLGKNVGSIRTFALDEEGATKTTYVKALTVNDLIGNDYLMSDPKEPQGWSYILTPKAGLLFGLCPDCGQKGERGHLECQYPKGAR